MDPPTALFQTLGISFLLGMLVGLERQRSDSGLAGMRTFPLITVFGTLSAVLAGEYGGWILAGGLIGVISIILIGNLSKLHQTDADTGTTTEIAMLLMFAVGAYLFVGELVVAIAVGAGVAVLLKFKPELHGLAARLGDDDFKAIMRFVLITFVILPVLPNEEYGLDLLPAELKVFNPFEIWLMVVLIVGISLGGYIAYKFLGAGVGMLLGGLIGGAISSTATTVTYARRTAGKTTSTMPAAIVIMLASSIVYLRVLVEISVISRRFLPVAAPPILIMMAVTLAPTILAWAFAGRDGGGMPKQENPSELKSALAFGALYAVVLFCLAAAKLFFGGQGLYAVAGLSGLTDMDAVTLSVARMVNVARMEADFGWRLIVIAAMANLVFKTALVALLGGRRLFVQVALLMAIPMLAGALLLAFWDQAWTAF